jgi:hypothetical protein
MSTVVPIRLGLNLVANSQFPTTPARGGIGGGNGGDMEARIAALEATVKHIDTQIADLKNDFRDQRSDHKAQFYTGLGAIAAIFGAIFFVFFRLSDRFDVVVDKISAMQLSIQHIGDSQPKKTP